MDMIAKAAKRSVPLQRLNTCPFGGYKYHSVSEKLGRGKSTWLVLVGNP